MVDAARWARVTSVFQEALERDDDARKAYLDAACAGDAALRAEVESLLAAHHARGSFMEGSPLEALPQSVVEAIGSSPSAPLAPGARLGPYEIVAPIDSGGMGEVFRARDTRLGREVAVKVLFASVSADEAWRQRFQREARAIAALNHPHICTIHDVGVEAGRDYLVLELLQGESLASRLIRGPLSLDEAITRALEMARALDRAHRAGVIHRDLKPGNVMLTPSGAKVLDFGLARITARDVDGPASMAGTLTPPLTQPNAVLGTLQYMAPEQIEGRVADARADVFAFGATLYEMLTAKRAFDASSSPGLIAAIVRGETPSLLVAQPHLAPALDRIVRTCLEKDPEARFASLHDVAMALQWVRSDASAGARATGAAEGVVPETRTRRAALAAGLTVIGGGIGYLIARSRQVPPQPPAPYVFDVALPEGTVPGRGLALSPDGRWLAVCLQRSGSGSTVWLLDLTNAAWQRIAESAMYPFWSIDGTRLAYFTGPSPAMLVSVAPQAGARPITICEAPDSRGGVWLEDGTIVYGRGAGPLMRVAATGGTATEVAPLGAGEIRWLFPARADRARVLAVVFFESKASELRQLDLNRPGEAVTVVSTGSSAVVDRGVLFYDRNGVPVGQEYDPDRGQVVGEPASISLDGLASRPNVGYPNMTAGGGHVAVMNSRLGEGRLVWMDRAGTRLGAIAETGVQRDLALSPDGKRLALVRQQRGADAAALWVVDADSGAAVQRTFALDTEVPVWNRDGTRIAFRSLRGLGGNGNIYVMNADGPPRVETVAEGLTSMHPAGWTADGQGVVWASDSSANSTDVGIFVSRPGAPPVPYLKDDPVRDASVSPDGTRIAYRSRRTGRAEIFVDTFPGPGAAPTRVSPRGGFSPRWRGDGRELYFIEDGTRLMAVSVGPGTPPAVGPPVVLLTLPAIDGGAGALYAPSPDGKRFLILADTTVTQHSIKVTLNWAATRAR